MTLKRLYVVALLAAPQVARAGELLTLQAQSVAPVDYATPAPVSTEVNAFAAELQVPIPLREGTYLVPGASYRLEAPRFIDPPEGALPAPRLHEVEVSLTGRHALGERWSLMGQVAGGLAGDLQAVDRGVVRLSGFALASRGLSESLTLGAGGALTWAFGRALPVPLVWVDWAPSEALQIEALLPAKASVVWRPRERWRAGVFAELVGNEYAIRAPAFAEGEFCTSAEPAALAECVDHLAYTDGVGGVLLGARVASGLWLEARGGLSVYRRFELLNADNAPVSFGAQRLPPAPFVRLRITYEY